MTDGGTGEGDDSLPSILELYKRMEEIADEYDHDGAMLRKTETGTEIVLQYDGFREQARDNGNDND